MIGRFVKWDSVDDHPERGAHRNIRHNLEAVKTAYHAPYLETDLELIVDYKFSKIHLKPVKQKQIILENKKLFVF